ncbi:protein NLRC3-like [Brachyhypopomus gauderio]|uniref:protein NLRC3-like n=1 Tax=Brachyhypopomus gauderio TaxID=698409 RepID=UPI00404229AD
MVSIPELLLRTLEELLSKDLKRFRWHLQHTQLPDFPPIPKARLESTSSESIVDTMCESYSETGALEMMVHILTKMNQNKLADQLRSSGKSTTSICKGKAADHKRVREKLKSSLKIKHGLIHEEPSLDNPSLYLDDIYTDLYIIKGGTGGVCNEHEVRHIQSMYRVSATTQRAIKHCDIFKARPEDRTDIRKVLTLGIAGVGKTVSVDKFVLDWAEGKANLDIDYIFPLTFRKLNLLSGKYSLMQLLRHLFLDVKYTNTLPFDESKVLFILDGLDESHFPLNFTKNEIVNDVQHQTSLDAIITNLIAGELIPAALVWVTSRPSAISRVPLECFNQITEIQGFSNEQKEEYFRKRISDPHEANKIIAHMKTSQSLHIMCHIPVFCRILATVLHEMLNQQDDQEIPSTLTGMYTRFLIFQNKQTEKKYHEKNNVVLKLGRLAFLQLQKGNVIFYEEDLKASGIDVQEASVYSGICTEMFKLDFEMQEKKCFSFVHLSIQEFLAALYVFYVHRNNSRNPVLRRITEKFKWVVHHTILDLHKSVINEALESKTGRLDLFLRFLLGLSIKSNEKQIKKLLPEMRVCDMNINDTIKHLKEKIRSNLSPERSINLFYCLNELRDNSLVEEVQSYVKFGTLSSEVLSPTQWSALVFLLMTSEDTQKLFDLKKYTQTDEGLMRLLPVVGHSNHSLLDRCNLTEASCEGLASVISTSSYLRHLDLTNNDLGDSGVKKLSDGLKSPQCKLEMLRLSGCLITEEGCSALAEALVSNPSHLKELDLSYNNPGEFGVQLLSARQHDPNCKLEKLR